MTTVETDQTSRWCTEPGLRDLLSARNRGALVEGGHAEKNAQRSIQGHHRPLPDTVVPVKNYDVETYRDGPWWMVRIPALDGLTQARSEDEIALMAREYIAVTTNVELEDVAVRIRN